MFSRDFIAVQNVKKKVVFWGAGFLQGIFLEGRVFTRDCFGGEVVYKVIFLGAGRS